MSADEERRQTAGYIFDMLIGLTSVARETDLTYLAYLLEMAGSEASHIAGGHDRQDAANAPTDASTSGASKSGTSK